MVDGTRLRCERGRGRYRLTEGEGPKRRVGAFHNPATVGASEITHSGDNF